MTLSEPSQKLKGISVSYVQDEDRLLLEILLEGASRPLWITRRAALRLIEVFNQQLAGIAKPDPTSNSAPTSTPNSTSNSTPNSTSNSTSSPTADNRAPPPPIKAPVAFERDIAATKNPPKPGVMKLNLEQVRSGEARVGVLKTIQFAQLNVEPVVYQIHFVDTHNQSIGLKITRELLLNLETLLIQQIERAQW